MAFRKNLFLKKTKNKKIELLKIGVNESFFLKKKHVEKCPLFCKESLHSGVRSQTVSKML